MVASRKNQKNPEDNLTPALFEKLRELRKSCGLRKFSSYGDRSFTQWKNEAENLIIRIFGENSNQYEQFEKVINHYRNNEPKEPTQLEHAAYYRMLNLGYTEQQLKDMSDDEWNKELKKKGVLKKLEEERKEKAEEYLDELSENTDEFKEKMKDAFTAWINELELIVPECSPQSSVRNATSGTKMIQIQTANISVKIDIDHAITNIIETILANEPDEGRAKEAETNLGLLKEEIKKETPRWSAIKKILEWALNFGRDVFIQVIPIILEKYSKQP